MKLRIFKNQYGYSTVAKNGDDKLYIQIQFPKGTEPNFEKGKIKIHDGFLSMYKNKVGIAFPKIVVMQYDIEKENKEEPQEQINEFDLPF